MQVTNIPNYILGSLLLLPAHQSGFAFFFSKVTLLMFSPAMCELTDEVSYANVSQWEKHGAFQQALCTPQHQPHHIPGPPQ